MYHETILEPGKISMYGEYPNIVLVKVARLWYGDTVLDCIALHCNVIHCTALYSPALQCTALYSPALHCTALYPPALHCTALYSPALQCTGTYLRTICRGHRIYGCQKNHWQIWGPVVLQGNSLPDPLTFNSVPSLRAVVNMMGTENCCDSSVRRSTSGGGFQTKHN